MSKKDETFLWLMVVPILLWGLCKAIAGMIMWPFRRLLKLFRDELA